MAIHDTFYTKTFQDVGGFYKESDPAGQVEFIDRVLSLRPQDKILDLACGYGRHSIILAQRGYDVTGYDQSVDYIEQARQGAQAAQVDVDFEVMDMRTLNAGPQFDAIVSFATSLAFYDDRTNESIFRRIYALLEPGGMFLFDQANILSLTAWILGQPDETDGEPNRTQELSDGRIHHRKYYFDAERCVASERSVIEDGENSQESGWDIRYYTLPEVAAMADRTGFTISETFGDYDCSPYALDSKRLITVMKKL